MYFTLCNQEIQNKLGNQMLACQDLLRHSQKCAGLMVSVKFSTQIVRPFPSSLVPLFQSESKSETILMKMTLLCMKIELHAELIFI